MEPTVAFDVLNQTEYYMNGTEYYMNGTMMPPMESNYYFEFILYYIVVPVLFGLTTLIGVIGNTLVIYVILSKQKMRTVTNILLLNLAFADLSFVTICPPFTAYQIAINAWPFGDIACKLMHYLLNITAYVTVYTLVLISVIRYMTIVHTHTTLRFRTRTKIVVMIIGIWVIMCALNVPILWSYGVQSRDGTVVCDNFGREVGRKLYSTFFGFAYVLPLTLVAIFSIAILRHIQTQRPTMVAQKRTKRTKSMNRKRQASRLIILVVVIFAMFWLPVHIHLLVYYFGKIPDNMVYETVSVLWNALAYFNSCVNPIIYNYASKDFRDGFHEAVCLLDYRQVSTEETQNGTTMTTRVSPEGNGNKPEEAAIKYDYVSQVTQTTPETRVADQGTQYEDDV